MENGDGRFFVVDVTFQPGSIMFIREEFCKVDGWWESTCCEDYIKVSTKNMNNITPSSFNRLVKVLSARFARYQQKWQGHV